MSAMINRRTVLAGTAFTGLAALLAACGSSSSSTASSTNKLEAIKSAGKIRVGLEGTYRPFSFHDSTAPWSVSRRKSSTWSLRTWASPQSSPKPPGIR